MPILDARGIQHQTHLSVETVEAPPSAVAQIIFSAADSISADMVIMGANRKPVGTLLFSSSSFILQRKTVNPS